MLYWTTLVAWKEGEGITWHIQICSLQLITLCTAQWCLTCCCPGFRISLGIMNLGPVSPAKPHLQGKEAVSQDTDTQCSNIWRTSVGIKNIVVVLLKKHSFQRFFWFYFNKMAKAFWEVAYQQYNSKPLCQKWESCSKQRPPYLKEKAALLIFMWLALGQFLISNTFGFKKTKITVQQIFH